MPDPRASSRAVAVEGMQAFRKAVRATDRDALKLVQAVTRSAAQIVASDARTLAPFRSGALRGSIVATTSGHAGIVRSPLPYAAVHEWGGTIRPRGTPFHIKRSEFVGRAQDRNAEKVGRILETGFAAIARVNGW